MGDVQQQQQAPQAKTSITCALCEIEIMYDYHGRTPPYGENVIFLEEVFCRRDPFSPSVRPLCVGGKCSLCDRSVCVGKSCSLFYTKRFCMDCARRNIDAFPAEVVRDIQKATAEGAGAGGNAQ